MRHLGSVHSSQTPFSVLARRRRWWFASFNPSRLFPAMTSSLLAPKGILALLEKNPWLFVSHTLHTHPWVAGETVSHGPVRPRLALLMIHCNSTIWFDACESVMMPFHVLLQLHDRLMRQGRTSPFSGHEGSSRESIRQHGQYVCMQVHVRGHVR